MRRIGPLLAFILAAPLLGGCVYDPYTGAFVPCCNYYGNPYYRYPQPYYPYGYPSGPYMTQPQGQPGGYPSEPQPQGQPGGYPGEPQPQGQPGAYPYPGQPPPGQPTPLSRPGASNYQPGGGALGQRLAAASVTHDGRLTQDQAAAGMPMMARNFAAIDFAAIDVDHAGYVTLPELRDFAMRQRAELRGQRQPDEQADQ